METLVQAAVNECEPSRLKSDLLTVSVSASICLPGVARATPMPNASPFHFRWYAGFANAGPGLELSKSRERRQNYGLSNAGE
jgi:hypothetical protein